MPGIADQRPPNVDWLVRRLEQLEARVRELSAARSLPASNFRGGALLFQDEAGNRRFGLGNVPLPPNSFISGDQVYGAVGYDDGGAVVWAILEGDRGLVYPVFVAGFHQPAAQAVTSATFQNLFETYWDYPPAPVLRAEMAVVCDAGTTGEIKLVDSVSGTATSTLSLASGYSGFAEFEWLHPAQTGIGDDRTSRPASFFPNVQARRVSGGGSVFVFPPLRQYFASVSAYPSADANGNAHLT